VIAQVHGKTDGLKARQVRALERLQQRKLGPKQVVPPEVARAMTECAADTGRMVGLLVDRPGKVTHVVLGDALRLYLPDIGRLRAGRGRLRGVRLLVAKPVRERDLKPRAPLSVEPDLITDLEKLGLDLVCEIEALPSGLPGRAAIAQILPASRDDAGQPRHRVEPYRQIHDVDWDFASFVTELEAELARGVESAQEVERLPGERDVAVIVGVYTTPPHEYRASLAELKELCRTAGVRVVDTVVQRRNRVDPRTIVGKGKLEDICLGALHHGADLIIFDRDLSPSQLNAITDLTDLRVLDRTMVILDIFARRATTRGGKLQVELAQLKYSLPRLAKKQEGLSRLTGGIGGQGPGETKLEVDRRRAKTRITRVEKELARYANERVLRRQRRNRRDVPTIAIVGYTNAGKSTLLNRLTGAEVLAENALFATLDTTSRRLRFPEEREVVLIDTVGFIRDLPEGLLNAFRATLEELLDADLLLHVVDGGDPRREAHIVAVEKVLESLGGERIPRILTLNKVDELDEEQAEALSSRLDAVAISALTGAGMEKLVNRLAETLWQEDAIASPAAWATEPVTQVDGPGDGPGDDDDSESAEAA
jgi:GTP-binding protein HflX